MTRLPLSTLLLLLSVSSVDGFAGATRSTLFASASRRLEFSAATEPPLSASASASDGRDVMAAASSVPAASSGAEKAAAPLSTKEQKKKERKELIRKEGGRFAFDTKYGALNPYAIYYGLTAILLGIPWFFALTFCQLFYFVTGNRFDKLRRMPIFISHLWGVSLMRLTRNWPKMINLDILQNFYKEKRPAMFVANHNSWMDIPFLGGTIGWRNYKLVSKAELGKVPILGKSIKVGGHVMLDRTDRKSQVKTLKRGIQYLKVRKLFSGMYIF